MVQWSGIGVSAVTLTQECPGFNSNSGCFSTEFVCSLCLCEIFSVLSGFLSRSKIMQTGGSVNLSL